MATRSIRRGPPSSRKITIREARHALDAVRALASQLEVTRATAEADLTHLAQQCLDAVAMPLDEVRAEVEQLEAAGDVEPDVNAIRAAEAPDPDEEEPEGQGFNTGEIPPEGQAFSPGTEYDAGDQEVNAAVAAKMTAEEAIAELRAKIDKLGPVNMMAIEQFSELDTRHTFLTTQRQDLVDSIAQTNEAIRRIDETTHARFRDAFTAINANFQQTFTTLFGGGRAGIALRRRERSARKRHRHRRVAAGQAAAERDAALGRREGAGGDRADVRDLQVQAEPVLPARRN